MVVSFNLLIILFSFLFFKISISVSASCKFIHNGEFKFFPSRYKVIDVLGKGGFGEVVKCWDCETKKIVTIKMATGTNLSEEMHLEKNNRSEAEERKACVELLKAMLKWDEKKRITPSEILAHPFITMNYISSSSDLSSRNNTALGSAKTESSSSQTSEASMSQANEICTNKAAGPGINQKAEPGTRKDTEPQLKSIQKPTCHSHSACSSTEQNSAGGDI